ncbi:uncharacterized protein LOC141936392 [Strix uralensis]|uniref:uncharacterized protein LOC141936392 n=1 Tax=Strix uralensis TaxID=36305 RepID=UPI003DA751E5
MAEAPPANQRARRGAWTACEGAASWCSRERRVGEGDGVTATQTNGERGRAVAAANGGARNGLAAWGYSHSPPQRRPPLSQRLRRFLSPPRGTPLHRALFEPPTTTRRGTRAPSPPAAFRGPSPRVLPRNTPQRAVIPLKGKRHNPFWILRVLKEAEGGGGHDRKKMYPAHGRSLLDSETHSSNVKGRSSPKPKSLPKTRSKARSTAPILSKLLFICDSRKAGAAAWVTEKELGKAETGHDNSFQRHAPCRALLETALIPTIHLNPASNKILTQIKAFLVFLFVFSWSSLSGAATHRCLEKPRSSRGRLAFVPSARRPAATLNRWESWWVPAGGCSFSVLFSPVFFTIYGCFQQIPGGEVGEERDAKGFTTARAKGQSVPGVRSRAGARAEKAFPLRGCLCTGNVINKSPADCVGCVWLQRENEGLWDWGGSWKAAACPTLGFSLLTFGCGHGGGSTARDFEVIFHAKRGRKRSTPRRARFSHCPRSCSWPVTLLEALAVTNTRKPNRTLNLVGEVLAFGLHTSLTKPASVWQGTC